MFKSNHQSIKLYLEGKQLFDSLMPLKGKNPGMALHFVALPKEYKGKLLQVELTSPYGDYSGAPGSIYLGTIASLEAYALSRSMLHTLLMVLCLAAGVFIMVLALWHRKTEKMDMGNFFFEAFPMLWDFILISALDCIFCTRCRYCCIFTTSSRFTGKHFCRWLFFGEFLLLPHLYCMLREGQIYRRCLE